MILNSAIPKRYIIIIKYIIVKNIIQQLSRLGGGMHSDSPYNLVFYQNEVEALILQKFLMYFYHIATN